MHVTIPLAVAAVFVTEEPGQQIVRIGNMYLLLVDDTWYEMDLSKLKLEHHEEWHNEITDGAVVPIESGAPGLPAEAHAGNPEAESRSSEYAAALATITKHASDWLGLPVQPEDVLKGRGLDSLDYVEFIMAVEDDLRIEIPDADLNPDQSLHQMALVVEQIMQQPARRSFNGR